MGKYTVKTCPEAVLQGKQIYVINFNLTNKWCLAMWGACDTDTELRITTMEQWFFFLSHWGIMVDHLSTARGCGGELSSKEGEKGGGTLFLKWDYANT